VILERISIRVRFPDFAVSRHHEGGIEFDVFDGGEASKNFESNARAYCVALVRDSKHL
jgi:hypothetical protein